MTPSELLTRLMDDVVHRPEEIRMRDAANLSVEELAVYMKFRTKQKRDPCLLYTSDAADE